jgi:hypothetical protein
MRRLLILLVLIPLACQAATPQILSPPTIFSNQPVLTQEPSAIPATPSATPTPAALHLPLPSQTIVPTLQTLEIFEARFHPDGDLYISDLISIEVIAPQEMETEDQQVEVRVIKPLEKDLGSAGFQPFGIAGRSQATLRWVWDTRDLNPGVYTLEYSILPDGPNWTESILLHPGSQIPPPQPQAHWEEAENQCCLLHYITGTDAARDLSTLLEDADTQADLASRGLHADFERTIPLTLLSRVLGHGGFAGEEIYVSYLDRNYAGNDFSLVLRHELIHLLDGRLGGDLRPSILVEGLAVFLSGGHYKPEPIFARAATLLDLDWYIPLAILANDFYNSQHEIGYIEGGALVQYLVTTYGWEAFSDFYRDIHPVPNGRQSQAIDNALRAHFDITFAQLESQFIYALKRRPINPDLRMDVRLTVAFYNTVRRYQELLDPSAYFLTAWLPSGEEMRQRGIVADYLRHPTAPQNVTTENMLMRADRQLLDGKYAEAERTISSINISLSQVQSEPADPLVVR